MESFVMVGVLAACVILCLLGMRLSPPIPRSENAFEREAGSLSALCEMLTTGKRIRGHFKRQVMSLGTDVPFSRHLPAAWRSTATEVNGAWHLVDELGRPCGGIVALPRDRYQLASRDEAQQLAVGRMGDKAGLNCDGGHLVPTMFGGWGKRPNLVPEAYRLNRGAGAAAELAVRALARKLAPESLVYYKRALYAGRGVLPDRFGIYLLHLPSGHSRYAEFQNAQRGWLRWLNSIWIREFALHIPKRYQRGPRGRQRAGRRRRLA